MRDMTWNVYVEDINHRQIQIYNIFDHGDFVADIKSIYKKHKNDFELFCKEVNRSLHYYFWSKCEWEIILSDWPPSERFKEEKIDVCAQVMLNWDIFINYVWEMCHARKVRRKKEKN